MRIDVIPSNRDFDEYQTFDIESATLFTIFKRSGVLPKMINVRLFRVFFFSLSFSFSFFVFCFCLFIILVLYIPISF